MWGEFEDDSTSKHRSTSKDLAEKDILPCKSKSDDIEVAPQENFTLRERIIHYLAASSVVLKSQQRYEPDLTYRERCNIAESLLDEKPGQFLYRFGKHLQREHLSYFLKYEGNPEIDYYLSEIMKTLNQHTSKITIKNRRYVAMQRLRKSGDYFSEKEMERRNPLLYDQLIGKHLTAEEKEEKLKVDKYESSFSSLLLHHIDARDKNNFRKQQEEEEDNMYEEDEEEESEEEEEEEEDDDMEVQVESEEKQLLKEEFYSSAYLNFLKGKDEEFDYGAIDASDDYDLLEIRARDEEERYFDDDDDDDESDVHNDLRKDNIANSEYTPVPQKQTQDIESIVSDDGKPGT